VLPVLESMMTWQSWAWIGAAAASLVPLAISHFRNRKFKYLMTMCGLQNKDEQLPLIIDKKDDPQKTVYILHLPAGLCMKDFENQKEELAEGFGGTVEITKAPSGELALTVYKNRLGSMYPFEVVEGLKPMEFAIGYSHKGLLKIDLQGVDPHMAIGGATNSGKSVFLKVLITAAILKPVDELIISLVDLKRGVEFGIFERSSRIENYAKDDAGTIDLLTSLTEEMNRRLDLLARYKDIENIKEYNKRFRHKKLPYHLLVIDEFTLLKYIPGAHEMVEVLLCQARAVGIHVVIALQTHHAENLPGTIKTNLGTIVSFKMRNEAHSRILLECGDAAKLRGMGHGLLLAAGEMREFQGFYIDSARIRKLIGHTYVEKKKSEPELMGVIPSASTKS
jgi:S-DNA-T family DNA segregation ATPase FtsK/SpoIIIE